MPFVEEDDEEKRRRAEAEAGGPVVAGTQEGTIPGSNGQRSPGASPNNSFVDVAAYLNANKPQAQDTANKVAGKLNDEEQGLESGIQDSLGGYQGKVKEGTVNPDDALVGRAAADPTGFVKNPGDVASFQKQRDAAYTGPGAFEETSDFGTILQKVKDAQSRAKGVDTSEGRRSYLAGIGTNPTAGTVALDDLLIGGDQNARATLTGAASKFDTLTGALGDAQKRASDALTSGRSSTEAAQAGVTNRFSAPDGIIPTFQKTLADRLAQTKANAGKNAEALKGSFAQGGDLNADELAALGLTPDQWQSIQKTRSLLGSPTPFSDTTDKYERKVDLAPYLTLQNPDAAFTRENVASADDYAKAAAIRQLMGDQNEILPADASRAGTAPKSIASIQGDPLGDEKNLLGQIDTDFLNQYKDFNLGAGDENYWRNLLSDPKQAASYQGLVDIFDRNRGNLSPLQSGVADQLKAWLDQGHALPPSTGDGGTAAPGASDRVRVVNGQMSWWDGNGWVPMPAATRYRNGAWETFNPNTGQYDPWTGSQPPVIRAGGGNYGGAV